MTQSIRKGQRWFETEVGVVCTVTRISPQGTISCTDGKGTGFLGPAKDFRECFTYIDEGMGVLVQGEA